MVKFRMAGDGRNPGGVGRFREARHEPHSVTAGGAAEQRAAKDCGGASPSFASCFRSGVVAMVGFVARYAPQPLSADVRTRLT